MKVIAETWEEFFELMEEYYETPQNVPKQCCYNGKIYDSCGCIIGECEKLEQDDDRGI